MASQKCGIRFCMLYDFKQGKMAAKSHRSICYAFGEEIISESQWRRWLQCFQDGNESLEDEPL